MDLDLLHAAVGDLCTTLGGVVGRFNDPTVGGISEDVVQALTKGEAKTEGR